MLGIVRVVELHPFAREVQFDFTGMIRLRICHSFHGSRIQRCSAPAVRLCFVRLGVLDVGSNTVNLLVVDARRGGHPTPMSSTKASLRLGGAVRPPRQTTPTPADKLHSPLFKIAASSGCAELMAFATSAVRDAKNSEDVLARVLADTGVALQVLSGVDEARLTFLAVRRWYG